MFFFPVDMLMFNVSSLPSMLFFFFAMGILGQFCPELSLLMFGLNEGDNCCG
jgi:hypothetical protein